MNVDEAGADGDEVGGIGEGCRMEMAWRDGGLVGKNQSSEKEE
jgi:hypothetical protein